MKFSDSDDFTDIPNYLIFPTHRNWDDKLGKYKLKK